MESTLDSSLNHQVKILHFISVVQSEGETLMSPVMRKPTFCICENKDADQLHGNPEADQRLCFRCIDSTITLPSISEISSL